MIDNGLLAGFYSSGGVQIGYTCNGLFFIPYTQGGIVMQDANGVFWRMNIFTDGTLTTEQFTP